MIPRLASRSTHRHAVRGNMGEPGLESLAAEFALLAQRRSKAIHQMQVLEQQRNAAAAGFASLQKRIAWLIEHIDAYAPQLGAPQLGDPAPAAAPEPQRPVRRGTSAKPVPALNTDAMAAIGRQWVAAQPAPAEQPSRPSWTRRG